MGVGWDQHAVSVDTRAVCGSGDAQTGKEKGKEVAHKM